MPLVQPRLLSRGNWFVASAASRGTVTGIHAPRLQSPYFIFVPASFREDHTRRWPDHRRQKCYSRACGFADPWSLEYGEAHLNRFKGYAPRCSMPPFIPGMQEKPPPPPLRAPHPIS